MKIELKHALVYSGGFLANRKDFIDWLANINETDLDSVKNTLDKVKKDLRGKEKNISNLKELLVINSSSDIDIIDNLYYKSLYDNNCSILFINDFFINNIDYILKEGFSKLMNTILGKYFINYNLKVFKPRNMSMINIIYKVNSISKDIYYFYIDELKALKTDMKPKAIYDFYVSDKRNTLEYVDVASNDNIFICDSLLNSILYKAINDVYKEKRGNK